MLPAFVPPAILHMLITIMYDCFWAKPSEGTIAHKGNHAIDFSSRVTNYYGGLNILLQTPPLTSYPTSFRILSAQPHSYPSLER